MKTVSPTHENTSMWTMHRRTTLHSINPGKNRYRFFVIELWAPPIGSGAALRKRWGRIGTQGQSEIVYFDSIEGAEHYADVLLRRRLKRGYVDADTPEWKLLQLEAEAEARLQQIRHKLNRTREVTRRASEDAAQLPLWAEAG